MARALAHALAAWTARTARHGIAWTRVDGAAVGQSPLAVFLKQAGFVPWGTGLRLMPAASTLAEPEPDAETETADTLE